MQNKNLFVYGIFNVLLLGLALGLIQPYILAEDSSFPIDMVTLRTLWYEETEGNNLALGRQCVYSPTPNYRLTQSDSDPWDLTDGRLAGGGGGTEYIWLDEKAVGWYDFPFAYIGLDLGEERVIDKVVLRVLGGKQQTMLAFPHRIEILLSEDGINYYCVSDWQKAREGDSNYIYLPEEGVHYVYPFSLKCDNRRARYVAVKMESAGFLFLDEIAVMEGTHPAKAVDEGTKRIPFKLDSAMLWSEVDKIWVCNNMPIYDRILLADMRDNPSELDIVFEIPQGVELNKLFRGWNEKEETFSYNKKVYGGKIFNQYTASIKDPKPYEPIRVLLQTNWKENREGEAFLYAIWEGGQQERVAIPLEAYHIEPIEPPKRFHTSIAWMGEANQKNWPDFFDVYRDLGFNAVPFFPRYGVHSDWLKEARERGFSILYNESPIHEMESRFRGKEEMYVLNKDGTRGTQVSLAYRGLYYQNEIERIERLSRALRPDWIFFDLEMFPNYASMADKDQQLLERMALEGWGTVADSCVFLATEMVLDISSASRKWADSNNQPIVGFYNVKPPGRYERIYDFPSLYPEIIDLAQPSLYVGGDAGDVGDRIKAARVELPKSHIIPWLTAGTYGEFPSKTMRDVVLEAFFNGSCGITFYIIYDYNSLDFKYTSEAIKIASKVEDIIIDGQLIDSSKLDTTNTGTRITGLEDGNGRAAILVSNYLCSGEDSIGILYETSIPSEVIDLDDDSVIGHLDKDKNKFCATLSPEIRSKGFLIKPLE